MKIDNQANYVNWIESNFAKEIKILFSRFYTNYLPAREGGVLKLTDMFFVKI